MDTKKLELLEARVLKAIDEISKLRTDNSRLEKEVQDLQKENEGKNRHISDLEQNAGKIEELSVRGQQLSQERDNIRLKVESLLDKLEKIDII